MMTSVFRGLSETYQRRKKRIDRAIKYPDVAEIIEQYLLRNDHDVKNSEQVPGGFNVIRYRENTAMQTFFTDYSNGIADISIGIPGNFALALLHDLARFRILSAAYDPEGTYQVYRGNSGVESHYIDLSQKRVYGLSTWSVDKRRVIYVPASSVTIEWKVVPVADIEPMLVVQK
jgi:hypothetical protein